MSTQLSNILFRISIFLVCFLGLQIADVNCQVRTRTIADSMTASYNGVWYNPNYYQFEVQYPKLQVVPPLSTGMDFETLIAYIYLDSLMRNTDRDILYGNYITRWKKDNAKNDTIVQAVKYLYKLIDYDPVRFQQYDCNLGKSYKIGINFVRGIISELFGNIVGTYGPYTFTSNFGPNSLVMNNLIRADYILKVHVNSIDSLPQRDYPPTKGLLTGENTYRVLATVIDTLKGKVFKNFNVNPEPILRNQVKIQSNTAEIAFTYGTGPYANEIIPFKIDPSLLNASGNLQLQPGQDLIVLLIHNSYLWDYNYDYLDLSLISAYPIIEGQVKDISHVWSSSSSLNYLDWKTIFVLKRDMLLNGGY